VALVAIGQDIQASILTTMNLKMLGIETIWVKAANKTHHRILSKLGTDRVILPEQEMGRHIAQMLHNPAVVDYVSLGNGYSVVNIAVPERMSGQPIAALKLGADHDLRLLGLMRGGDFLSCERPETVLQQDDKLILLGRRPELRRFGDVL
jgi:trk system potassium uptake protein TrkA